jgi:hypothetical protein
MNKAKPCPGTVPNSCKFSYYLCGLIEGDGTFYVPRSPRSPKGAKLYPSVQIEFQLMDLTLAQAIQKEFGYGSICRRRGKKSYVYTINNWEGILRIISLLNDKMKTPKVLALYRLIDWVNDLEPLTCAASPGPYRRGESECLAGGRKVRRAAWGSGLAVTAQEIPKLPINSEPFSQNAWLSGFIEAEGHFSIRTSSSSNRSRVAHRVECKFELVQALVEANSDPKSRFPESLTRLGGPRSAFSGSAQADACSNRHFMSEIADFFKCSFKEIRASSPQYIIRSQNVLSNTLIEGYLTTFPLFGKKRLDYLDWLKVFACFKSGRVKHNEVIKGARLIKEGMNDRRTEFVWDHLQNFYRLEK